MQSSSVAVLCTLLVTILSVAQIPSSHATMVELSSAAGDKLMAEVAEMEKRGDVVMEKTATPMPRNTTTPAPQSVCGVDTSRITMQRNVCKLNMQHPDGRFVCSGWVVSRNMIATAGHCVLTKLGYALAVTVTCGGVRIAASHAVTPAVYYNRVFVQKAGAVHWADAAVIRLSSALPSTIVPWRFVDGGCQLATQNKQTTVSGYPASSAGRCKYDGIDQWSSAGNLKCKQARDGFYSADFDTCGGGSGSVVYVTSTRQALGIFSADSNPTYQCANFITRILDNAAGGVNSGLGISIKALIGGLPA